ncbi:hypothetical protein H4S06_005450, partial [Coemansia sp. BCRC 34490]
MSSASTGRESGRLSLQSSNAEEDLDNQTTEELTGFQWDENAGGGGGGAGQDLTGAEGLSDIGGIVSQAEASMDFTTNLEAAMEGVQKRHHHNHHHQQQLQEQEEQPTHGRYGNVDDIS